VRAQAVTLFPPKAKTATKKRRPTVGFKAPPDIEEYLETLKARGYGQTEACLMLLRLARDAEREVGDALSRIETMARTDGASVGQMIGRLALQGLKAKK
jgi:hypothetical protein